MWIAVSRVQNRRAGQWHRETRQFLHLEYRWRLVVDAPIELERGAPYREMPEDPCYEVTLYDETLDSPKNLRAITTLEFKGEKAGTRLAGWLEAIGLRSDARLSATMLDPEIRT